MAHLVRNEVESLLVNLESFHLLKDYLGKNFQLVVVTVNSEQYSVRLCLELIAETCELCIVRVLDKRVFDKLSVQARLDSVHSGVVDEGARMLNVYHEFQAVFAHG